MIRRHFIDHLRRQQWTALFLDFVIVVVGILLALQISEWNEVRHDRMRERAYLVRMSTELEQSIKDIESSIKTSDTREQFGRLLISSVSDSDVVRADPGRFIVALHKGAYTFSPAIRSHTFDEIKSVGDLDLFQDKALLAEISEFYTDVDEWRQWSYIRELKQTEYIKRAAGILSFEQITQVTGSKDMPETSLADAQSAYERMLERPAFIEWLPIVANRGEDVWTYRHWLKQAEKLRSNIQKHLDKKRS